MNNTSRKSIALEKQLRIDEGLEEVGVYRSESFSSYSHVYTRQLRGHVQLTSFGRSTIPSVNEEVPPFLKAEYPNASAISVKAHTTENGSSSSARSKTKSGKEDLPYPESHGSPYDVFLSFTGRDTRRNFSGHLYSNLQRVGIHTFKDDAEIQTGDDIGPVLLKAIEQSKISIPIISKNYSSSKWCLRELAQMVECRTTTGQIICPIFFHVDPSDVGKQALSFVDSAIDPEDLKTWRKALKVVAKIKGFHVTENEDESLFIESIIQSVSDKLKDKCPLVNVERPFGIEFHVRYMLSLLNLGAKGVCFVGICGMSGIGKTTIVKALYEQILNKFMGCCFLEDVTEHAPRKKDLVVLQQQLASRILKRKIKMEIGNAYEGSTFIKERMQRKKVLIILDNVSNDDQIKALAGDPNWFGEGSRIIITTTSEDILTRNKVDRNRIHKPQLLDEEQSLQLFSRHAFSQDHPLDDYMQLSLEMVKCAQGLPLALVVLGSSLIKNNSIKKWKSELEKYKRVPHHDIHKTLKISYEQLTPEQQSLFLDIACFLNGVDKRIAFYYWESLNLHPETEFLVLIRRSLVKIVDDKKIWMHNQLQSMGRRIIYEENPKDPAKRSRLWIHEEVMEVLKEMGSHDVEGILLDFEKNVEASLSTEDFKSVARLRLLNVNGSGLKGDFKHIPSRLRCLFWQNCNFDMPPTDFHHEKLVILDLSFSNVREIWKSSLQNKEFKQLKVLNITECLPLARTPDFSMFPNLERLILKGCCELVDLHESIGILKHLVYLDLRCCSKLKELPGSTFQLTALRNLVLSGCKLLENLPESIGSLKSLVKLFLDSTSISKLPDAVGLLEKLEVLIVMNCINLVKLPRSMAKMRRLQHINLSRTCIESLPDDFLMLSSLVILEMAKCRKLRCFPEDRPLGYGVNAGLCKLQVLDLEHCKKLESLPKLSSSLHKLNVIGCSLLKKYDDLGNLKFLKELFFGGYDNMVDLPSGFGKLSSLDKLVLSLVSCDSLPSNAISSLSHLALVECQKIVSLPELPLSLMKLHLHSCHALEKLPNLSNLKILEELKLEGCGKITEIQGLEQLQSLRLYEVTSCHNLTDTTRKVQGQGTLKDETYELHGNVIHTRLKIGDDEINKGLVMGLAISSSHNTNRYMSGVFDDCMLHFGASILRNGRRIHCLNDLLIKVRLIDTSELFIYIHYFEGCKWFGFPLQRGDVIEAVSKLDYIRTWNMKFFHLSVPNNEDMHLAGTQEPCLQKVEDFFNWIDKADELEETTELTVSTLRLYRRSCQY